MNYLSQTRIPLSEAVRCGLTDGYAWHRALWQAFPGKPEANRDFLFRIDPEETQVRLLLLSADKPESVPPFVWETKAVAPEFLEHERYRFQVRCNPTLRRSSDKRRLGIFGEDRLHAWFARKAEAGGFRVADGTLTVGSPLETAFRKAGRTGKHVSVEFSGVLNVVDRSTFHQAFARGIGSAKGFGFGLLMLQPIS